MLKITNLTALIIFIIGVIILIFAALAKPELPVHKFQFAGKIYVSPIPLPECESWTLIGNYTYVQKEKYAIKIGEYISYSAPKEIIAVDYALCERLSDHRRVLLYIVYTAVEKETLMMKTTILIHDSFIYTGKASFVLKEAQELEPYLLATFLSKYDLEVIK